MENKITFIAKYPVGKKQQDGASVRILEIDNIFSQHDRVYIESFSFPIKTLIYWFISHMYVKYTNFVKEINNKLLRRSVK